MVNFLRPYPLRLILTWASLAVLVYGAACVFLLLRQNRFIFLPTAQVVTTPAQLQLKYEEVWLPVTTASQQGQLHGWWIPARDPQAKVLLYLHGNGINIGANIEHAARYHQMGFAVFIFDYRGYGRSVGAFPTEAAVYQDAAAAWAYLTQARQIPPSQIFLYGHSLGGAIAIDLALKHPKAAGLIVESSFTSMQEMTHQRSWTRLFPVRLLLHQRFDSLSKVPQLQVPVLYLHGSSDRQVPVEMSQRLAAATPQPVQLMLFSNADHNNVAQVAPQQYFSTVRNFIRRVEAQQQQFLRQQA